MEADAGEVQPAMDDDDGGGRRAAMEVRCKTEILKNSNEGASEEEYRRVDDTDGESDTQQELADGGGASRTRQ